MSSATFLELHDANLSTTCRQHWQKSARDVLGQIEDLPGALAYTSIDMGIVT